MPSVAQFCGSVVNPLVTSDTCLIIAYVALLMMHIYIEDKSMHFHGILATMKGQQLCSIFNSPLAIFWLAFHGVLCSSFLPIVS